MRVRVERRALHRFTIHGAEHGLWRPGAVGCSTDAWQVRLSRFGLQVGERFTYDYNFFATGDPGLGNHPSGQLESSGFHDLDQLTGRGFRKL